MTDTPLAARPHDHSRCVSHALAEAEADYVSRDLLQELLEACEEAIDWLETQLGLIDAVTLPNYLQAQIDD